MTITEATRAPGQWSLTLAADTPREKRDAIQYFGHVVVSTGRPDPRVAGDTLLTSGRYTGVVTGITENDDGGVDLSGQGMAFWLGDADKKGDVIESLVSFSASTFTNAIRTLLPASGSITEGSLHSVTGTYTGTHQWQSPREAIDYVCTTMGAEWRVNNNGTLDAGLASDLFVTTPVNAIVAQDAGVDLAVRAMPGHAQLASDVEDYTTRVVLLAQGDGASVATGTADIAPGLNPYKDLHGNTVKRTRMVSESATDQGNATARAQLALNQFTAPRQAVKLSTDEYDIRGDGVSVGDYVWVHAPDAGLIDTNNELLFRGLRINPVKLRIIELAWPVEQGMAVAFRDGNGVWTDLTDYVVWESGETTVTVGGYDRALTNSGAGTEDVGSRPQPNTSLPATPAFTTPFTQSVYQSTNSGITKAQVQVVWAQPLNTDGTAIIDGDHYEVRYRTSAHSIFPSNWLEVSGLTWSQMDIWDQPINLGEGPWQTVYVGWDFQQVLLQELTPGVPYDIQIRAVDNGTPPNYSDWSASTTIQTVGDTLAPSTPAAPSVAASRIAIQVTHTLGKSSGGTYNLEQDLHHLEIHAQYEPLFTPTDATLLGKLIANNGMIMAGIPAVGTFQVESTAALYFKVLAVDEAGNKSNPSTAVQATANLIDDAHISDLTVTKVTAGTINADWIVGARIKTADTGARVELNSSGLQAYNSGGTQTVSISAADGSAVLTGKVQTGTSGDHIVMDPTFTLPGAGTFPTVCFYAAAAAGPGRINATGAVLGVNSPPSASGASFNQTTLLMGPTQASLQYNDQSNTIAGGGVATVDSTAARIEYQISNTRNGGYTWVDPNTTYLAYHSGSLDAWHVIDNTGTYQWRGKFNSYSSLASTDALQTGQSFVSAGFGSLALGYGATMASTMSPVANVVGSGTPNFDWCLTNLSSTGFTVAWSDSNAHTVNWLAMRM
jgi:hypothetical protein